MDTKLTVELIPKTSWYTNVRSQVPAATWKLLQKEFFRAAKHQCQICGGRGEKWAVELHEQWQYIETPATTNIEAQHIQKLVGLIALCPSCHEVKHIGLAELNGHLDQALAHLAKINRWSKSDAQLYVEDVFETWAHRSYHPWELDISFLSQYGVQGCLALPKEVK